MLSMAVPDVEILAVHLFVVWSNECATVYMAEGSN